MLEGYGSGSTLLEVYRARDLAPLRDVSAPARDIATERQGYLFTSGYGGLYVFAPGGTRLVYRLHRFLGGPLAFDRSGKLHTLGVHEVAIYAPTAGTKLLYRISRGLDGEQGLTIGSP